MSKSQPQSKSARPPKTVKTAISIDRRLFEAGESTARKMKVSRSRLYAVALQELLKKQDAKSILAAISSADFHATANEDQKFRNRAAQKLFKALAAEEQEAW